MEDFRRAIRLCLVAACISAFAQAASIGPGTLGFGGQVEVTLDTLDFTPFLVGEPLNGTGRVVVLGDSSGSLAGLSQFNLLNQGTIVDRSVTGGVVPPQPAGQPISVPDWLRFDDPAFQYVFDLTHIQPGLYSSADCFAAPANQQTCTPPAPAPFTSPYNLSNFIDAQGRLSSNADFSFRGTIRDKTTGAVVAPFNGVISAHFLGVPYQTVLNTLFNGSGRVVTEFSGRIETATIPEPSTALFLFSGFALIMMRKARFNRK